MAVSGIFGQTGAGRLYNGLSGTPSPIGSASQAYAALTRQQWADYVSTFVPVENQLIQYATNTALPGEAMAQASQNVDAAFTQQQGATQRKLAGMGVTLSADEQAAQQKAFGLSKSLADVQAQNTAGQIVRGRQQSLLGNPVPVATPPQGV